MRAAKIGPQKNQLGTRAFSWQSQEPPLIRVQVARGPNSSVARTAKFFRPPVNLASCAPAPWQNCRNFFPVPDGTKIHSIFLAAHAAAFRLNAR